MLAAIEIASKFYIMIGIYAGTFDPITNGHLWVIKEGIRLFKKGEFRVVVIRHRSKNCMFSLQDRMEMIRSVLSEHELDQHVKLDCIKGNEGLIGYVRQDAHRDCKRVDCDYFLLRGIRNAKDFKYEAAIAERIRKRSQSSISIIFVTPPETVAGLSSTAVKEAVKTGSREELALSVSSHVLQRLLERDRAIGDKEQ